MVTSWQGTLFIGSGNPSITISMWGLGFVYDEVNVSPRFFLKSSKNCHDFEYWHELKTAFRNSNMSDEDLEGKDDALALVIWVRKQTFLVNLLELNRLPFLSTEECVSCGVVMFQPH